MRLCRAESAASFIIAGRGSGFFSRKRVAKYKYPEHIVVIEKLPRTASGKIQKFLLRKDIMRRLTQDVCEEIE